ncbi:NDR1/HIN1-like protein 13 [Zingiber officinale]|uniref:Late embryogenesis abundant protein LEA-2 subgroup domain-containing protein n=1 Tax=Zingiber officinale TaxID=94328 RepID=A0A8J5M3X2_ZINOF|nr:NDR1/HIN1-like protein 13 [Zingiber officinale]KAG6533696.1 hypothetical protein ZIOFF_007571 [Zingiber officinale]
MSEPEQTPPTTNALPGPVPQLGTFVVQVAKDQVYRVPPPENAYLVERYCKRTKNRRRSPGLLCLIWILAAAFLLLAATSAALHFALRPAFAVQSLSVQNTTETEYDLTLSVWNPSRAMGYSYAAGGSAALVAVSSGAEIAAGETPGFDQGSRSTTAMPLALRGSGASPPKGAAALELTAKLRARPKLGKLKLWSMRMEVTCGVLTSALAGDGRILSQHCGTKLWL